MMSELVATGNSLSKMMVGSLPASHPGAHIGSSYPNLERDLSVLTAATSPGYFDSHALFEDILSNPGNFLNGTVAPNTTGAIKSCVFQVNEDPSDSGNCTIATGSAVDSFLW